MLTVGYIGLGLMGKSIARNILKAGYPLIVYNRSRPAVEELAAEGAQTAASPAEVASRVEVVFTNLPDTPDVEQVVLGVNGIASGAHPGLIWVDNSSIKPAAARSLAAKLGLQGVLALDAPVSGGDVGARNATLAIMVGGPSEALDKVLPVLQAMGKTITHVGEAGAGQVAKAANQIMVAAQMVAMGELLIFSQKAGVDSQKVIEAIKGGAAQCWTLDVKPPRLFAGNRLPGFKSHLMAKDLNIILETAREYGIPLPSSAVDAQLFNAMVENGMGDLDNSAVVAIIEELAGVNLKTFNLEATMKTLKKFWPPIRDTVLLLAGALVQAAGLRLFMVPAQLASGGISGISQLINHFTGWPIGLMVFFGNIPLFLLGWRMLGGRRFAMRTLVAVLAYSFFLEALVWLPFFPKAGITDDLVLNSLFGAVMLGIGYGLVYRAQGTSGGTDILARILNRWRGIPMTQSYLMTDALVILAAGFIFGWQKALYAIIVLYVSGLVVDSTLEGVGTVRTALIITDRCQEVADRILGGMERGVTILEGTGAFTGEKRPVLYCVVTRSEVQQLKTIVREVDPKAFMVIGTAHEALGEGFQSFKKV